MFGAQRRVHGMLRALSRRHHVTAVAIVDGHADDLEATRRAMREVAEEVDLVALRPWTGVGKRLLQLGTLLSPRSFVHGLHGGPPLRRALARQLRRGAFDVVTVELPFLALPALAVSGDRRAHRLVLDEHNIEFDLARQQAADNLGAARRVYNAVNWRKVRHEELTTWRRFDGVAFCSDTDEARALSLVPRLRSRVVPNAVDLEYFARRGDDPPPDGRTVMFFGAIDYFPNEEALRYFVRDVWPRIEREQPQARLKIVGRRPTPEVLSYRGPRVEVTGEVDDVRPHLASAALTIAPLRIGGGTRFKIIEAMAKSKAVVATTLGAEGIALESGRHLLLADTASSFAAAVVRVLRDHVLAAGMG